MDALHRVSRDELPTQVFLRVQELNLLLRLAREYNMRVALDVADHGHWTELIMTVLDDGR